MARLSAELLAQVRRIEIRTGRMVSETLGGRYRSVFKGQGIEFAEVREYLPGDEVRSIDWNVTARAGRPFIKRYAEERELNVMLACDLSGSQAFGSGARLKREAAAELTALLALSALQNNDKAGLALFTDRLEKFIPPAKGRKHALLLVRELLAFEPKGTRTSLAASLDTLGRMSRRRSLLFVVSDFMDQGFERTLRRLARRHDLVPVVLEDPLERGLPDAGGLLEVEDPETGERLTLRASSSSLRSAYASDARTRREELDRFFKRSGIEAVRIPSDGDYITPLVRFFQAREARRR